MECRMLMVLLIFYLTSCLKIISATEELNNATSSTKEVGSFMCQEDKSAAWCIPSDYVNGDEPWKYRHLSNSSLPFTYHYIFNILEVEEINDETQTITIAYYFRIKWKEPRLIVNANHNDWGNSDRKGGALSYQSKILKNFWTPDLEIMGLKVFGNQKILKEMSGVEIFKSQYIKYSARVETTFSCQMVFSNYPLDSHSCPFRIASYLYTTRIVNCSSTYTVENTNQRHLQHMIAFEPLSEEDGELGVQGNRFALCGLRFNIHRTRVQIFFQAYLTSILFVFVSWVSFLIKPEIVPGRMGLIITIFLVLINIFNGIKSHSPTSPSLNAVDIYLVGCIGQVFFVLSEYAIVLSRDTFSFGSTSVETESSENDRASKAWSDNNFSRNKLDLISIFIFPIIFIVFNIIYWSINLLLKISDFLTTI